MSTSPLSPGDPVSALPARTPVRGWAAVAMLTAATFLVVTAEMLPVGVLTPMAAELGVSAGAAGSSLTITGLVAAVTAPVVPRLLGDLDRRWVLAAAMLLLALANALTAIAGNYGVLALARVALGIGMGTVWGLAAAVATRLVAPRNAALAVSFAVSGVASASVFGVPLGTLVGNQFGWRAAFGAVAVSSAVVAAGLLLGLPRLRRPEGPDGDPVRGPGRSLMRPAVVTGLMVVVLLVTAHFAAYTYVRPVLETIPALAPDRIALLLFIYGVFGLAGNFLAGATASRHPRTTVLVLAGGVVVALIVLVSFGAGALAAGLAIALWGLAYGGLSVGGQLWVAGAAPDRIEHITGIYVGVFTASIALGAFAGGVLVGGAGIVTLLLSAAAVGGAALLVGLLGRGPG